MNAFGDTVPFSAGFVLMCRYKLRSAESSVGGDGGIGTHPGTDAEGGAGAGRCDGDPICGVSETDGLRVGLGRGDVGGGTCWTGGGGGTVEISGTEGSGYCMTSSRKGLQK